MAAHGRRFTCVQITERLLSAAKAGESVVYAVPGDPCIAEMTVRLLREAAGSAGIKVRFPFVAPRACALHGVSFAAMCALSCACCLR